MSKYPHISERLQSIAGRLMHHPEADVRSEGALILRLVEEQEHEERREALNKGLELALRYTPNPLGAHSIYK